MQANLENRIALVEILDWLADGEEGIFPPCLSFQRVRRAQKNSLIFFNKVK